MSNETSKAVQDLVHAHVKSFSAGVAEKTGVAQADVEKVMKHLGLETALSNRFSVSPANLRIAAGQIMQ